MPKGPRKQGGRRAERLKEAAAAASGGIALSNTPGVRQSGRLTQAAADAERRAGVADERLRQRKLSRRLDALEANNREMRPEAETFAFDDRSDVDLAARGVAPRSSAAVLADRARGEARARKTFRSVFGAWRQAMAAPACAAAPSYFTAVAAPSRLPARHLCVACGSRAAYACVVCGDRLCRPKCLTFHKDSQCA